MVLVQRTHIARPMPDSVDKIFVAPEAAVAKQPAGTAVVGAHSDELTGDAPGSRRSVGDRGKTTGKICVAPMMDWTS